MSLKASREALFGPAAKKAAAEADAKRTAVEGAQAALTAPQPGDELLEKERSQAELQRITRDMGIYLQTHAARLTAQNKTLAEVVNAFLAEFKEAPEVDLS